MINSGRLFEGLRSKIKNIYYPLHNMVLTLLVANISIGSKSRIDKVYWGHSGGGAISIGKNTSISNWVCMMPYGGFIRIGDNCSINSFCHINGNGGTTIGNNVRIAAGCVIIPANHKFEDPYVPITFQGETQKGVIVCDDVWIGAGVTILDGVKIGKGSVIGAGSVVNRPIPAMSVAVGVPAKIVKKRGEKY
ncbi:acyltransferase [uncultured Trichococcus sp.]|uniref:acyltransferase n=1 Tax=uncultured Trichococcus sp. TaxID=189665 RepID=UPI002A187212|nr:acyltransferase [uncultured Trichococcus sp.]